MGVQLKEGRVHWFLDLNASTSGTAFPSSSTQGVAVGQSHHGSRVHVKVDHSIASGTVSLVVALYGYTTGDSSAAGAGWYLLGMFNGGSSMAANSTAAWSPDASTVKTAEVFACSGQNFDRFMTRQIAPGGTGVSTTTYIGFPTE